MAQILYVNNTGGGFADRIEVADGTTIEQFFRDRMGDASSGDYLIRVNRLPASRDQVLQDGDRVTVTPTKIEGAHRVRHQYRLSHPLSRARLTRRPR